MTIKVGDKMPAGTLTLATKDGPQKVSAEDFFKGKKVALFSVPGAFTPTCDAKHLPGFVEKADEFKAKGINAVACMSVNDAFVMKAWGKAQNVEGKVRVSDGSGEIRAKNIVGDFIVDEDGSGNIDVAGVGGSMRVEEDGSGGIDVDRVAGDFTVDHKGSGSIRSSGVRGKIDIPDRHRRRGDN